MLKRFTKNLKLVSKTQFTLPKEEKPQKFFFSNTGKLSQMCEDANVTMDEMKTSQGRSQFTPPRK